MYHVPYHRCSQVNKHPITNYKLKFNTSSYPLSLSCVHAPGSHAAISNAILDTYFIPVTSATTLSLLRTQFLQVLKSVAANDPTLEHDVILPATESDLSFWKLKPLRAGEENEVEPDWIRLEDEKSGADKWGMFVFSITLF